jgi:two-component system, chemotaxis family, chemotaxis protein CheY
MSEDRPITVLVVEDNISVQLSLADLLIDHGCRVAPVQDGQEALEYLRSHPAPDVILLDLLMPRMDGWEFRRQMRREPEWAAIPLVIVSAIADMAAENSPLGAAAYLSKPFDVSELLKAIERCCARFCSEGSRP